MKNVTIDLKIRDPNGFKRKTHSKITGLDFDDAEETLRLLKKKYS